MLGMLIPVHSTRGRLLKAFGVCACGHARDGKRRTYGFNGTYRRFFDSGLGGISVAREIRRDMPNEHVLYFGDSANAPYGTKSPEQVRELSDVIVKRFVEQGVKAVVIACNTATSAAANELRDTYDIPIIGMEPALRWLATVVTASVSVIVAATP